jgi:hypothetical protein
MYIFCWKVGRFSIHSMYTEAFHHDAANARNFLVRANAQTKALQM